MVVATNRIAQAQVRKTKVKEEMKGLEDLIPPPPPAFDSKDGDSVESAGRRSSQRAPRRRPWG